MKSNSLYTEEQLKIIYKKFPKVNSKLEDIFIAIAENEKLALHEMKAKVGVGDFVRDKCIAALTLSGFVDKTEVVTEKIYSLTEDGKNLFNLIRGN